MEYKIIPTAVFQKEVKRLYKKYDTIFKDIEEFEGELLKNHDIGEDLGGKLKKIRIKIRSKNKGKSGGARIITYNVIVAEHLKKYTLLLFMINQKRKLLQERK